MKVYAMRYACVKKSMMKPNYLIIPMINNYVIEVLENIWFNEENSVYSIGWLKMD